MRELPSPSLPSVGLRPFTLRVNREIRSASAAPAVSLLDLLRDHLGLTGAKEACGRGECGACTVLVDGQPVLACLELAAAVDGEVTTIEGLAEDIVELRAAFADRGGFQCGYCTPGQLVRAAALLERQPSLADRATVRRAMSGNICRCTGYDGIISAILDCANGTRP